MKFVFLAGGFAGFLTTAAASFWAGHQPDRILFDGAVGCLIAALLFRWFWNQLIRGIRDTLVLRNQAATAAATAASAKAK